MAKGYWVTFYREARSPTHSPNTPGWAPSPFKAEEDASSRAALP